MRNFVRALGCVAVLGWSGLASAFIASPVGGRAGDLDISARLTLERGKVEPNENLASFQKARWNMYSLGLGYTIGDVGPLRDFRAGVEGMFFYSPAEVSGGAARCLGVTTADGRCQFYPSASGSQITPRVSANLIHEGDISIGLYLQSTIPLGYSLEKFVLPRADYVAGGVTAGARFRPWLTFESNTFVGSGAIGRQNGAVAQTTVVGFEAQRWILPWRAGIKVGPYFEGDITERLDERYDAAYTAGFPARTDRIRSMRFAVAILPWFRITDDVAVSAGYVQKLFGYDATATSALFVGVAVALPVGATP